MNITIAQQKRFWVAFASACRNLGLTEKDDQEAYRKRVLKQEGGVDSLTRLDRTAGFDKVMGKLSMDAGDYAGAIKYVESTAYRLISVLEIKAKQAVGPSYKAYIQGIMSRSGIGAGRATLKDCTESELRALIAILDTQRRRSARTTR